MSTPCLFRTLLGPALDALPPAVRAVHDGTGRVLLQGTADCTVRPGPLPWLICAVMGLPATGRAIPVTLDFRRDPDREHWVRRFGRRRYESRLRAGRGPDAGLLAERLGPFTNLFRLEVRDGVLAVTLVGMRFLGVRLPRLLCPSCAAVEWQGEDGSFRFDIPIDLPGFGRLIRYSGQVRPAVSPPASRSH